MEDSALVAGDYSAYKREVRRGRGGLNVGGDIGVRKKGSRGKTMRWKGEKERMKRQEN